MAAALAEASSAAAAGERVDGAVAVLDDAMVASACDRVRGSGDPTAHAVIGTLREAAERLGTTSLSGLTVYVVREPCAMCVGAMLESDVDGVVFAVAGRPGRVPPDRRSSSPAASTATPTGSMSCRASWRPMRPSSWPAATDSCAPARPTPPLPPEARDRSSGRRRSRRPCRRSSGTLWYPLARRGVRVVDGAALEKRCAKAPRVRIPPSPPLAHHSRFVTGHRARRGRLVA